MTKSNQQPEHQGLNWKNPKVLLRDDRFWKIAGQVIAVVLVVTVVLIITDNLLYNLDQLGIQLGFDFLDSQASFDIGETLIPYSPSDSYSRAIVVGLVNSLRVMVLGLVLATIVGLVVGIARLSDNWLIRKLALVYVETFRNVPLLLQLFFWYFAFFLRLPPIDKRITLPGSIYLTGRGIALPWLAATTGTGIWLVLLALGVLGAAWLWRWRTRLMVEQGSAEKPALWALGAIALSAVVALIVTQTAPFFLSVPQVTNNTQFQGGLVISPEIGTLLLALVIYTGSFIAEIVRGGIQSVPKGQVEAAQALGLKSGRIMQMVILPQALRVIIPPLTSQYLNLAKNSSLAIAIGYPDIYFVASTTFNQTGRAVEVMLLLMVTYLTISLFISLVMNLYNQRVQLKER
ncbi:MAG TPA: ABC transporter permease subunit [Coleofasciculaceae cyanobacterium]|jgi:general L-amino acid transport system permease protein